MEETANCFGVIWQLNCIVCGWKSQHIGCKFRILSSVHEIWFCNSRFAPADRRSGWSCFGDGQTPNL